MKLGKVTITKQEKEDIKKYLDIDPCTGFDCSTIDCDNCPFHEMVAELNNVRFRFRAFIDEETAEEND